MIGNPEPAGGPMGRNATSILPDGTTLARPRAHVRSPIPNNPHSNTIIEALEVAARSSGNGINLLNHRNRGVFHSYRDILQESRRYANYLLNRGLRPRDRVIILLPTTVDFLHAFFGTLLAGGVPVPTAPPFSFGKIEKYLGNLTHIIRSSGARFFLTFPRVKLAIGPAFAGGNNISEVVMTRDIGDEAPIHGGFPAADPTAPALFQYTSGTTGLPKGAMLSNRAIMSNCHGTATGLHLFGGVVAVSWLPLFHDMGLIGSVLTGMYIEAQLHVMSPESFVMQPRRWLENISRYKAMITPAPNFAYHLCCRSIKDDQLDGLDLSSWKIALNGAEPVDKATVDTFQEKFSRVGFSSKALFPVYGMAENCLAATFPLPESPFETELVSREQLETQGLARQIDPQATGSSSGALPVYTVSVGYPLAGQEIRIVDKQGSTLLERQVGEILVHGPSLMDGYHDNPAETSRILRDGWLYTGDLGYVSQKRLFVTGRKKEMIIKMGRNYYPYDIERIAGQVDGVRKGCLAAFSAFNTERGSEDLVLVAETRATESQWSVIQKRINGELLSSLGVRADKIIIVPAKTVPKTSSGKVQRLLCKKLFLEDSLEQRQGMDRYIGPVKTAVRSLMAYQGLKRKRRNSSKGE